MSAIRDYLNFGIHKGLEACIEYNDGIWDPKVFKRWSANLSGDTYIMEDNSVIIYDYPTSNTTVQSLQFEMRDLCNVLHIEFICKKRNCIIKPI